MSIKEGIIRGGGTYTAQELSQLHAVLYDLLAELIRVCDLLQIPYFLQGGSAMGAFYENAILPWDDDIDVGMKREDYERFLQEAPCHLRSGYFLQWFGSEPHFPMAIAKLRKDSTLFLEENNTHLQMHHGIFIDIMAYDRVPDNQLLQKAHRYFLQKLYICLTSTENWVWRWYRTPTVRNPRSQRFLLSTFVFLVTSCLSKQSIFNIYDKVCKLFNQTDTRYYNQAKESLDHISCKSLEHLETITFGPLKAKVPANLEEYLHHHYGNITRYIPKERQINHYPLQLRFAIEGART